MSFVQKRALGSLHDAAEKLRMRMLVRFLLASTVEPMRQPTSSKLCLLSVVKTNLRSPHWSLTQIELSMHVRSANVLLRDSKFTRWQHMARLLSKARPQMPPENYWNLLALCVRWATSRRHWHSE